MGKQQQENGMNGHGYIYPHYCSDIFVVRAWHKASNRWTTHRIQAESSRAARETIRAQLSPGDQIKSVRRA